MARNHPASMKVSFGLQLGYNILIGSCRPSVLLALRQKTLKIYMFELNNFMLQFREWIIEEAISLLDAMQLYGYQRGQTVDMGDLMRRYRSLAMQHHPDRQGDPEIFKKLTDGRAVLAKFAGQQLNPQTPQAPQQRWVRPAVDPKADVREELTRAISAIKKGQPEDAFAAVSRLVDPYTGKLNSTTKPILKTSLNQWLNYYKQGYHDYLLPILTNALQLI